MVKISIGKRKGVAAFIIIVTVAAAALVMGLGASIVGLGELELGVTAEKGGEALALVEGCAEEYLRRLRIDPMYAYDDVTSGLVTHLRFDESISTTAADASGNNHNGALLPATSPPLWEKKGKINGAVRFDGTDDYIEISTPNLPTEDFTYSAWVKLDSLGGDPGIFSASDGSGTDEFSFNLSWLGFLYTSANGSIITLSFNPFTLNTWEHVAVTRSGTVVQQYVNGQTFGGSGTLVGSLDFGTCPFIIGANVNAGCTGSLANYWRGSIDDVRIYNRALSQAETTKIMTRPVSAITQANGSCEVTSQHLDPDSRTARITGTNADGSYKKTIEIDVTISGTTVTVGRWEEI